MSNLREQTIEKIAKQIFTDNRSGIYTPQSINWAWDNMGTQIKLSWLNKARKLLAYVPNLVIVNRDVNIDFMKYGITVEQATAIMNDGFIKEVKE
jgi:hypothetical protein